MPEVRNESVSRVPHPRLRPFVDSYTGYRMVGFEPGTHAGLPSKSLTMIIAFDDPLDVANSHIDGHRDSYWAMLGGLHSRPAIVHHPGRQHGIQVAITPRGAQALFQVPARTLARGTEHLDSVAPAFAAELVDRVSEARTWRTRWAILDEILLRALDLERELPHELERAWSHLVAGHGATTVSELAKRAGWSRRHFTKKFNEHYGLSPKLMARILRFERAQKMLRLPTRPSLGSIAAVCGYADQAHMTRDWVEFAGSAPTLWLADESLPSLQETDAETCNDDRHDH